MKPALKSFFLLLTAAALLCGAASGYAADQRIEVKTLDDLPRLTYPMSGPVSEMIVSDEAFGEFAAKLNSDIAGILEKYDIGDAATLQRFHSTLSALALLDGRDADALAHMAKVKELEDKEATRLTTGLGFTALIAARQAAAPGEPAYVDAFAAALRAGVAELPWDKVQERIRRLKGSAEMMGENFLMGMITGSIDPVAANTGEISLDVAENLPRMRVALKLAIPLKETTVAVYQEFIDAHAVVKQDIWPARDLVLEADRGLEPVTVAIWDSGVDAAVFGDAMYVNEGEVPGNGLDDDDNGFVDDVNGIAFDLDGRYVTELLHPLGEAEGRIDEAMASLEGVMDLNAGFDTPAAAAIKKLLGEMPPEKVGGMLEDFSLCGLYAHGTHVAGIASAGNPFIKLLGSRITFDFHNVPQPMDLETARRHADSYQKSAVYFREHDVRVVNMSWGWTLKELETALEANDVGGSPAERGALAGELLGILKQGLIDAMTSSPDILFVVAAGNDDNDVAFDEVIPSNFVMPNVMVVGAVDQSGDPTGFTSSGDNVRVYSNGFQVESYVPGGDRMKMSGTSMSAPNVTNLAAKLVALDPQLSPEDIVRLIEEGADRGGSGNLLLINPLHSAEVLGQR